MSLLNEKPILFNTEMVKAILEGRKTQTRRVIPLKNNDLIFTGFIMSSTAKDREGSCSFGLNKEQDLEYLKPKYKVGDILYVREAFKTFSNITMNDEVGVIYKADNKEVILPCNRDYECEYVFNDNWKPSIHMPKKYARIFLKVTKVSVERLQDISMQDVLREGISMQGNPNRHLLDTKEDWIVIWNSTAKNGYKWEDNPYVFVYEFERVEK